MPVLDLGNICDPFDCYRAQIAVGSVILWPRDEAARKQYLAAAMAHNIATLNLSAQELPDPARACGWFETMAAQDLIADWLHTQSKITRWFEEAGGLLAVAQAPPLHDYEDRMIDKMRPMFAAGLILGLIRRMAAHHADLPGGASVNKAVFILERVSVPGVPRNSHDLRRAWASYKPTAHFCAALFDLFLRTVLSCDDVQTISAEMDRQFREEFPVFLSEADAYQQFGTEYVPPRSKGVPILDANEAWLLPQEKQWVPTRRVPAPLDASLLEVARSYRAPVPGA